MALPDLSLESQLTDPRLVVILIGVFIALAGVFMWVDLEINGKKYERLGKRLVVIGLSVLFFGTCGYDLLVAYVFSHWNLMKVYWTCFAIGVVVFSFGVGVRRRQRDLHDFGQGNLDICCMIAGGFLLVIGLGGLRSLMP